MKAQPLSAKEELQKFFLKATILKQLNWNAKAKDIEARNNAIHEFLTEKIYQSLLGYGSGMILRESEDEQSLQLIDPKIPDIIRLDSSFGSSLGIPNSVFQLPKFESLENFEKTVAACNILGETNYGIGALLVKNSVVIKLDHDNSVLTCHKTFASLMKAIHINFVTFKHNTGMHHLVFDVTKYHKSLTGLLSQLNQERIVESIDHSIAELQKSGLTQLTLLLQL